MTDRARSGRSLRRPTLGEWVALVVAEALVWLVAVVVDGYADWPPLPWIIAAAMLLVLVGWLLKLRYPKGAGWGGGSDRVSRTTPADDPTATSTADPR